MSKLQRITVECTAPPALGAFSLIAYDCAKQGMLESISWLFSYLIFAYLFAIVPSLLYAGAMETWFSRGLHHRFGIAGTTALSGALGALAGECLNALVEFEGPLVFCGAAVGLSVGFYVARTFQPAT